MNSPTMALSSSSSSSMFLFPIYSPPVFLNGNLYPSDFFRAAVNCSGRFFFFVSIYVFVLILLLASCYLRMSCNE
jgi:hypothetical protein